jgi:single-stranded-DNA-specific exonuclease
MADPKDAFILLSTDSEVVADEMVKHLNAVNDDRKVQVAQLVKQIHKQIEERKLQEKPIIVLGNPDWKPPVLGLVATNIVREYNKPVFLWGRSEEDVIKGSCRGPEGVDVVTIMRSIPDTSKVFVNMGGHSASGGFSLTEEGVHIFEESLIGAYTEGTSDSNDAVTYIDAHLLPREVSSYTWNQLSKLAPFGEANQKPLFLLPKVFISAVKFFGKNKEHVEIGLTLDGSNTKAIKFFAATDKFFLSKIEEGGCIDLVGHLEKSMFKNYPEYRVRIVDVL